MATKMQNFSGSRPSRTISAGVENTSARRKRSTPET